MSKRLTIRNSTAEFLIFQAQSQANGVEVFYQDEMLWLTQKAMSTLFDVDRTVITKHLKNIFESEELQMDSVCAKFAHTAEDGKTYSTQFYNLDAVISVGYRVNSTRATQFRQWATAVLRQFAIRGYVLDKKRMENGAFLTEDYFEHLLAENVIFAYLCAQIKTNTIMEVAINSKLYQQASTYAQKQGLNLTSVIENFLVRFVTHSKANTSQAVPDIVLSLLGAGEQTAEDDLNAREAYYQYLEEKLKRQLK